MFKFIKSNKAFYSVFSICGILALVLCYGILIRNVAAVVLGATIFFGFAVFLFAVFLKEMLRLRHK